jgi:murein DD-endopeptidase MepM/ murein hydrolase activator NlpD
MRLVVLLLLLVAPCRVVRAQPPKPRPETIVHVVSHGDTLLAIAECYGTTVAGIAHANGIADPSEIYPGQRLIIPGRGGYDIDQTVPHVVAAGETLAGIADRYRTTWRALAHINGLLSPNLSSAGQVIRVPGFAQSPKPGAADAWSVGGAYHTVQRGETVFGVGLTRGLSTWSVLGASQTAHPGLIYPGQILLLPVDGSGFLPAPFLWVETVPLPIEQGEVAVAAVRTTAPITLTGVLFGEQLSFYEEAGVYYALIGVHVHTEPGLYDLILEATSDAGEIVTWTVGVVVTTGPYGYERIRVPATRADLLDAEVVAADRARLDEVVHTSTPARRWDGPLERPGSGTVSSYFGTHRSYGSGGYTSYHTGTDFRGASGTPVHVAAAGTVVLAEALAVHGNTVVVDHGWGLLTGYAHLSKMDVESGQEVHPGDQIGRIGNTGLSTAAHLHWEVWVNGVSVNGLQWLQQFYEWPSAVSH